MENGFSKKIDQIKKEYLPAIEKAVKFGHDEIMTAATKNLSGPHYGKAENYRGSQTGQIPVPRITSMLIQSLRSILAEAYKGYRVLVCIFSDVRIAPHNKFVHYGTRYMRPRRFLQDPVKERKQAILNRMNYEIMLVIRRIGQKKAA